LQAGIIGDDFLDLFESFISPSGVTLMFVIAALIVYIPRLLQGGFSLFGQSRTLGELMSRGKGIEFAVEFKKTLLFGEQFEAVAVESRRYT
jgi:hypothetical protein